MADWKNTELIPTEFNNPLIGVSEPSYDPRIIELTPALNEFDRQEIYSFFQTRIFNSGFEVTHFKDILLFDSSFPPPTIGPSSLDLPDSVQVLRTEIANVCLAAGFTPNLTLMIMSYQLFQPNSFPMVFNWHKDAFDNYLQNNLLSFRSAVFFYSPFESGTETLLEDPLGIPCDKETNLPLSEPTELEQRAALQIGPEEVMKKSAYKQSAVGNVVGFDLINQPWHRSPASRENLLLLQAVQIQRR